MSVFGKRKAERPGPSEGLKRWLLDGEHVAEGEGREEYLNDSFFHPGSAWRQWRDVLLPAWIAERAGTRPAAWWTHDLPRGAARLKLGGTGEESAAWYQSEALWGYHSCDPEDPPRVESVPTFLRRLKLLQPAEEKRVPKASFRPVRLEVDREGWAPPLGGDEAA
jgi:hypothetical protein